MAKWLALSFSLKGAAKGRAGRWDLLRGAAGLKGEGPARIKAQHVRPASTGPTDRAGGASREAPPPPTRASRREPKYWEQKREKKRESRREGGSKGGSEEAEIRGS